MHLLYYYIYDLDLLTHRWYTSKYVMVRLYFIHYASIILLYMWLGSSHPQMTHIKICYGKISCWDKCFLQLIFIINLHLFWRHLISYFIIVSLFHLIHIKICYGEINLSLKILVFFSSSASVYCLILFFCWLILFFYSLL